MNILIANTQEFNPQVGGVEKVSTILAKKIIELGHYVVFVACIRSKYSITYHQIIDQIILPNVAYNSEENKRSLSNICVEKEIHVVLNQAGNIGEFTLLCSIVTKQLNIPLISAIHTSPMNAISSIMDYKFSPLNKFSNIKAIYRMLLSPIRYMRVYKNQQLLYRKVYLQSDAVVLLSKEYIKQLKYLTRFDYSNKMIAIANPHSSELITRSVEKEKVVLFVGRLDFDEKRPDRLVRIWEKLFLDFPDWTLKFAGNGDYKKYLINYIKLKKIQNIKFLGFCDVSVEYQTAAIICLTSTIEGFPMVLIEAMSYGCVPISFDSFKSIYDIIDNNENGFIIKSFHLKEYEKKLRLLMENRIMRDKMGENATESNHKFDIDGIVSLWISLFASVIKGKTNE